MSRILQAYDKDIFKITPNFLVVTFKFDEPVNKAISTNEQLVLNKLQKNPNFTKNKLALETGLSIATVKRAIVNLQKKGIIERVGSDKSGSWSMCKTNKYLE